MSDIQTENKIQVRNEAKKGETFVESNAGDGTRREDHYLHGPKLFVCISGLYLCTALVSLDQTIVATVLQAVGDDFNASNKAAWLATGYSLANAIFVQFWGNFVIVVGRVNCLIATVVLFEVGSLVCALAKSMNMLISGRVVAGIGGAGIQTCAMVIMSEIIPMERRPKAMSLNALVFAVFSVVGPLIGGAFTSNVSWRWCFYINLPVGGAAIFIVVLVFHPPKPQAAIFPKVLKFDWLGFGLLAASVALVLLGLGFGGNEFPWSSAAVICCFILSGLIFIVFCVWNFKLSKNPLVPATIVTVAPIVLACIAGMFNFGVFITLCFYITTYFQVVKGYSSLDAGYSLIPFIMVSMIFSVMVGFTLVKVRYVKVYSLIGAILVVVGCGLLCLLRLDSSFAKRVGCQLLVGAAIGLALQPYVSHVQLSAPRKPGSMILATTLYQFCRNFGAAFVTDVAQLVYTSTLNKNFSEFIDSAKYRQLGLDESIRGLISNTSTIKEMHPATQSAVRGLFMAAIRSVFYLCIGFSGISLVCSVFLPNHILPKKSVGATEK